MAKRYTDEFRRDAVRMATTSGLTRPQLSSDLGVGVSTLNKWVQQHQHDDLMSGPHGPHEIPYVTILPPTGIYPMRPRVPQSVGQLYFVGDAGSNCGCILAPTFSN